jgi:hypothetical protein
MKHDMIIESRVECMYRGQRDTKDMGLIGIYNSCDFLCDGEFGYFNSLGP